MILTQSKLK